MDCNKKPEVDLHIHSNASDGTLSPEAILQLSKECGLKAISITDHDTLDGSRQALESGIPPSLMFIPGVEISAAFPADAGYKGSCHILGYGIRLNDENLNKTLSLLRDARKNRNPGIIRKLNECGISITIDELMAVTGDQAGRPHIAGLLMEKEVVNSIQEAFDKYLGVGKPAYVEKYRIPCTEALAIIKSAGGVPVLAHPCLLSPCRGGQFENLIGFLKSRGLSGIEVFYSDNTPSDETYFNDIADRFGLLKTGGTDFHGSLKPEIRLGSGADNLHIPIVIYEKLAEAIHRRH